jgi:flavin reductase (DIM6/NTAB) family NADH-FMN oxidoreductase RutF/uncharacterized protein YciI
MTTTLHPAKVAFDPDKHGWHPSVLPGQIVLVSTVDADGTPNVAPKSWVTMAAFAGPIVAFGCTEEHLTLRNVEATGEFVVNVVAEPLTDVVWEMVRSRGRERLRRSGLTLVAAQRVRPPLVLECPAHLECELDDVKRYGAEALVFGRIVAASIDRDCTEGSLPDRYFRLRPVFFLEEGVYGSLDTAKRVGGGRPADQPFYVVEIGPLPDDADLEGHLAFLRRLRDDGRLLAAGPCDTGGSHGPGELLLLQAPTPADAEAIAGEDPLVRGGAQVLVRSWTRTF